MLTPKNALMILNELHQGIKFTIQEQLNALAQTVYTVTVDVSILLILFLMFIVVKYLVMPLV